MLFKSSVKKFFCSAALLFMFILAGTVVLANESFADASGPYSPYSSYNEGGNNVKTYVVTYEDGVEDDEVFETQVYPNLKLGEDTPEFDGTPVRDGYTFVGWDKEISETVTGDVTYVAVWEPVKTVKPRPPVITYTVIYTDGVEGEDVFTDQVNSNLYYGETTPTFKDGIPEREGYVFAGWDITISDTVTGNVVYTATWIPQETVDIEEEAPPLSEHPEMSEEKTSLVTVPEPEAPLADVPELDRSAEETDIPQTGDSSELPLWAAIFLLAGSGLAAMSVCQRRKGRE